MVKKSNDKPAQPVETDDESEIILQCQQGNRHAFGILVERYKKPAFFTALGFVGDHDTALDLSQEAFVKAYRAIKSFENGKRFFTWYYRILRNLCFNHLRDSAHRPRPFSEIGEQALQSLSDAEADPEKAMESNEVRDMVWRGLNRLKVHEKEIILLKDFQDFSYKEIAEALQCPLGTVMSRLYTARKALKGELERILAS
ncbi:sigma-70 family RNA polymerase sigma factor [candidate division KSB1 bacterium]|nr:sigma-70 family RNA polymerase sigma factor [candidate division KSB1 bacterium]